MTQGHELKVGNVGGRVCAGLKGVKGGKWDNCNSIINKIYFLKKQFVSSLKLNMYYHRIHSFQFLSIYLKEKEIHVHP